MGGGPSLTDSIAGEGLVAVNMWVKPFNFYMTHFTERKPERPSKYEEVDFVTLSLVYYIRKDKTVKRYRTEC